MARPRFVRTDWYRLGRLGKNRRKKQVWRSAKGKHSKIRRKRRGYPIMPAVGYKTPSKDAGKISGKIPVLVNNMKDLKKVSLNHVAIISGRIGAKKKMDIIKKAEEMKIKIHNLNQGGKKE